MWVILKLYDCVLLFLLLVWSVCDLNYFEPMLLDVCTFILQSNFIFYYYKLCLLSLIFFSCYLLSFKFLCLYSVQSLSRVQLSATPRTAAHQASLSITNSWSLLMLISIKSMTPSNHLILCRPLLVPTSIFPSIMVFSNESVLHIRWPKYWSFSLNIIPSNEYSGLISFRMVWLDLLAVQGTLKSLLQHHSSKA